MAMAEDVAADAAQAATTTQVAGWPNVARRVSTRAVAEKPACRAAGR